MVKIDVFQSFTHETYKTLQQLRRKKSITDEEYIAFGECKTLKEVKIMIHKTFSITEKQINPIWMHIINNLWRWKRANPQESTVYNNQQSSFIKELLNNNGIYERNTCLRNILTDIQISTHIKELEEMQQIISLRTSKKCGNKTIYALHPDVRKDAMQIPS